MKLQKIFSLIVLCLGLLAGPAFSADKPDEALTKVYKQLETLLPSADTLGAKLNGEIYFYGPENLYEYIDGAAVSYSQYEFQGLAGVMMLKDGVDATIDIYGMGTPLNAFGIYSAERSPDFKFMNIGLQANGDEATLNFLQQSYYVKITAFGDKEKCATFMKAAAESISKKIGKVNSFPKELNLFPAKNKIANSEKYYKKNAMGIGFLRETYASSYKFDDHESVLMISIAPNPKEAQAWIPKYKEHFKKLRSEIQPISNLGDEAFQSTSKYEGTSIVVRSGKYLVVLSKPAKAPVPFLKTVMEKLLSEKETVSK